MSLQTSNTYTLLQSDPLRIKVKPQSPWDSLNVSRGCLYHLYRYFFLVPPSIALRSFLLLTLLFFSFCSFSHSYVYDLALSSSSHSNSFFSPSWSLRLPLYLTLTLLLSVSVPVFPPCCAFLLLIPLTLSFPFSLFGTPNPPPHPSFTYMTCDLSICNPNCTRTFVLPAYIRSSLSPTLSFLFIPFSSLAKICTQKWKEIITILLILILCHIHK